MAIDLNKRIEKVKIVLEKKQLVNIKAQVGVAFDISGSMHGTYRAGVVQDVAERILAIACQFDDNQNLDSWSFDNGYNSLKSITLHNYATYINDEILQNDKVSKWGGTNFAPLMNSIISEYFPSTVVSVGVKKLFGLFGKGETVQVTSNPKTTDPSYVIIITDGANGDEQDTIKLIESSSVNNVYWQFVGIGDERFTFLNRIADKYKNVGFIQIKDIASEMDEDLYAKLLNDEFCNWVK
jgi:uncharacterized protein with von Willebrand factor type A (vWA) domain